MKFDWVYLCSDPRRLEMTLRHLPALPGLERMRIVYCSHFQQVTSEALKRVAKQFGGQIHWTVEDLSDWGHLMPKGLASYFRNDRPAGGDGRVRTLGCKLLIPLIFDPPLLYTDDDVLVLRDPLALYEQFGEYGNRGSFRLKGKKRDMLEDIVDAFDGPEEFIESFDEHIIGAGVFFIQDRRNWYPRLQRFARCPYVSKLTQRSREFFCLDQRFVTAFGMEHGWKQLGLKDGFRRTFLAGSRLPRNFFEDTTFVHYGCAPRDKTKWVDLLQEHWLEAGH